MSLVNADIYDNTYSDNPIRTFRYDIETICPICKSKISPIRIVAMAYDQDNQTYVCILNYCSGCHSPFISIFSAFPDIYNTGVYQAEELICSEPNKYTRQVFEDSIIKLSPSFEKIYNQSHAAEASGLDEIAGLGYRKSLEFLVKDFAIHEHPDDEEEIKKLMLSPCIKKYIDNPQIKTLVERSAWIGNDEAHYIRKQADRDVRDMKAFIQATVYFIGMVLITEDAESMEPAK